MSNLISFAVVVSILMAEPAFAYVDPGTGSMLLQVVLGGFAAVGVVLKLYWHKIRAAVGLGDKPDNEEESG